MKIQEIVPLKIVIDIQEDGTFKDGYLLYKIKLTSGEVLTKTYSISINSKINVPVINGILNQSRAFVKQTEEARGRP